MILSLCSVGSSDSRDSDLSLSLGFVQSSGCKDSDLVLNGSAQLVHSTEEKLQRHDLD